MTFFSLEYIFTLNNFWTNSYNVKYKMQKEIILSFVPTIACWNKTVYYRHDPYTAL